MQLVKRGIYYEDAFLGVTLGALLFPLGTILIDAPLRPEDARSWRTSLLNQRGGANRLLVSLDAHIDRTLGARALECTILSHQKTAHVFRNRPIIFKGQTPEFGSDWEAYNDVIGTRWASPDITFTHQMILHWGGPTLILEHRPGPAPGAIWALIPEEKVAFVGDAVSPAQPPFLAHAELPAWIEALGYLTTAYSDYTVICGRGGPVRREDIAEQIEYLNFIHNHLELLAAQNIPPEETDDLIPVLLRAISFPTQYYDKYAQRLRAGLYQYYNRRYRPTVTLEPIELDDEVE